MKTYLLFCDYNKNQLPQNITPISAFEAGDEVMIVVTGVITEESYDNSIKYIESLKNSGCIVTIVSGGKIDSAIVGISGHADAMIADNDSVLTVSSISSNKYRSKMIRSCVQRIQSIETTGGSRDRYSKFQWADISMDLKSWIESGIKNNSWIIIGDNSIN